MHTGLQASTHSSYYTHIYCITIFSGGSCINNILRSKECQDRLFFFFFQGVKSACFNICMALNNPTWYRKKESAQALQAVIVRKFKRGSRNSYYCPGYRTFRVTRQRREKLLVKHLIILRLDIIFVWVGGKGLGFFSSHPKGTEGNIHKTSNERIQRCQKPPFLPPSHF